MHSIIVLKAQHLAVFTTNPTVQQNRSVFHSFYSSMTVMVVIVFVDDLHHRLVRRLKLSLEHSLYQAAAASDLSQRSYTNSTQRTTRVVNYAEPWRLSAQCQIWCACSLTAVN